MKLPFTIYFFALLAGFSCSDPSSGSSSTGNKTAKKEPVISKPPSSFADTLIIDYPSAVFFTPDSLQQQKIKEITDPRVYENDVHTFFYLMRNARAVLEKYWPQVHRIETSGARWLCFKKKNRSSTFVDLNDKGDMCGVLLFDGSKEPELADMMNIDTALGFYFSR